jgi:hypothetical protein
MATTALPAAECEGCGRKSLRAARKQRDGKRPLCGYCERTLGQPGEPPSAPAGEHPVGTHNVARCVICALGVA